MPEEEKELYTALRMVYGSALLNGPFAIVLGMAEGMVALNDRIKLRPLVAARDGSRVFVASEESAIREICAKPEVCLLYTSDAADDLTRVDLGGRRIIKKKKNKTII